MHKDFDAWNRMKQRLDGRERFPFASPREIWWCALGINVGVELNGKHEQFERPIVVIRAYNAEMLKVVPLSTRSPREDRFHLAIVSSSADSTYAVLSQARVISARRLLRKVGKVTVEELRTLKRRLHDLDA